MRPPRRQTPPSIPVVGTTPAGRTEQLARAAGEPLDDVLREVAEFRVALETDLLIAAAAADADEPELAVGIVDDERTRLTAFHGTVLDRLAALCERDRATLRRRRRRTRRAAAATVAAVTAGVLAAGVAVAVRDDRSAGGLVAAAHVAPAQPGDADTVALEATAEAQLARLSSAARRGAPASTLEPLVAALHKTLATLSTRAAGQPDVAAKVRRLLTAERRLLARNAPDVASRTAPVADRIAAALAVG